MVVVEVIWRCQFYFAVEGWWLSRMVVLYRRWSLRYGRDEGVRVGTRGLGWEEAVGEGFHACGSMPGRG